MDRDAGEPISFVFVIQMVKDTVVLWNVVEEQEAFPDELEISSSGIPKSFFNRSMVFSNESQPRSYEKPIRKDRYPILICKSMSVFRIKIDQRISF